MSQEVHDCTIALLADDEGCSISDLNRQSSYTPVPDTSPLPVKISSIIPAGGIIPLLHAVVARVYPVIYMCKNGLGRTGEKLWLHLYLSNLN